MHISRLGGYADENLWFRDWISAIVFAVEFCLRSLSDRRSVRCPDGVIVSGHFSTVVAVRGLDDDSDAPCTSEFLFLANICL